MNIPRWVHGRGGVAGGGSAASPSDWEVEQVGQQLLRTCRRWDSHRGVWEEIDSLQAAREGGAFGRLVVAFCRGERERERGGEGRGGRQGGRVCESESDHTRCWAGAAELEEAKDPGVPEELELAPRTPDGWRAGGGVAVAPKTPAAAPPAPPWPSNSAVARGAEGAAEDGEVATDAAVLRPQKQRGALGSSETGGLPLAEAAGQQPAAAAAAEATSSRSSVTDEEGLSPSEVIVNLGEVRLDLGAEGGAASAPVAPIGGDDATAGSIAAAPAPSGDADGPLTRLTRPGLLSLPPRDEDPDDSPLSSRDDEPPPPPPPLPPARSEDPPPGGWVAAAPAPAPGLALALALEESRARMARACALDWAAHSRRTAAAAAQRHSRPRLLTDPTHRGAKLFESCGRALCRASARRTAEPGLAGSWPFLSERVAASLTRWRTARVHGLMCCRRWWCRYVVVGAPIDIAGELSALSLSKGNGIFASWGRQDRIDEIAQRASPQLLCVYPPSADEDRAHQLASFCFPDERHFARKLQLVRGQLPLAPQTERSVFVMTEGVDGGQPTPLYGVCLHTQVQLRLHQHAGPSYGGGDFSSGSLRACVRSAGGAAIKRTRQQRRRWWQGRRQGAAPRGCATLLLPAVALAGPLRALRAAGGRALARAQLSPARLRHTAGEASPAPGRLGGRGRRPGAGPAGERAFPHCMRPF
eukprot:SAG25_NODE_92_length_16062_cov_54.931095_5_plen_699_part_00